MSRSISNELLEKYDRIMMFVLVREGSATFEDFIYWFDKAIEKAQNEDNQ